MKDYSEDRATFPLGIESRGCFFPFFLMKNGGIIIIGDRNQIPTEQEVSNFLGFEVESVDSAYSREMVDYSIYERITR